MNTQKTPNAKNWKIERTVTISGEFQREGGVVRLRRAIIQSGCILTRAAQSALKIRDETIHKYGPFPVEQTAELDLVFVTREDLGIKSKYSSYSEVHRRARELGLHSCPGELGPDLRAEYKEQPLGERLILMDDIGFATCVEYFGEDEDGETVSLGSKWINGVYEVSCDEEGRYLNIASAHPESRPAESVKFVYVLPRK